MKRTSKKLENLIGTIGNTYKATKGNRYAKAWREDMGEFRLVAGNEGLPFDYQETHESPDALEKSMRDFANLRHWAFDPEGC